MGFLDKLLGRGKDAAESAGGAAKDVADKAGDVASDAGDKAQDTYEAAKDRITGEDTPSEVGQAEQQLDEIRDQAARDQGRMP
jgi:hypothetical protein